MADTLIATDKTPWFDVERGMLDRSIFSDEAIYQRELTHIFARAWNFVCHESQIPEPGDYFLSYIGEDEVIAVRDRQRKPQVLLNSCPHRGNTVCRAEQGNTRSFFCSYHGWNFDLDGRLIGMPAEAQFYRGNIDKEAWGLGRAAQVESYRGFVFATMDPRAPPLTEYLGWVGRLGLDMLASRGDMVVLDGVQKNRLQCNWKLAVDNLYDWYHVKVSHGATMKLGMLPEETIAADNQMVLLGDYGHGIGGPGLTEDQLSDMTARMQGTPGARQWFDRQAAWRADPEVQAKLGPIGSRSLGHPNIFPNLWVALTHQVCLRIPRGPFETELWWFTLVPRDIPDDQRRHLIYFANHFFGPAGLLEQDDGENWSHSTRGARGTVTRNRPLNYSMGLGLDRVTADSSGQHSIDTVVSEHGQRWTYQAWQEWMLADSWDALIAEHSSPPSGVV